MKKYNKSFLPSYNWVRKSPTEMVGISPYAEQSLFRTFDCNKNELSTLKSINGKSLKHGDWLEDYQ